MRIHLTWLEDFVEVPPTPLLCQNLSEAGVEVDGISDTSALMAQAIVGEVREVAAHPQADALHVCQVFDGSQTQTVVCGAPNVAPGMLVAYLPVGGLSAGGPILSRKIRGVVSDGMLCSRQDLGLEGVSQGLWALTDSCVVGQPLTAFIPPTVVLDLGITPNRPDLLSHLGVAREVAASTGKRVRAFKWRVGEKGPDVGLLGRVLVEDSQSCRRYMARVIRNVRVAPSPPWLQERLAAIGQRSINNVVDTTNYVMHEFGIPLHAYDLSRLALEANLPTLRVRRAQAGEHLRTLDAVERTLTPDDLVIADAMRPVALAGVMGGIDTWIQQSTTSVMLEGAWFAPAVVRRTAKAHGIRSEASLRFERGCDPGMVGRALDRCAQLLCDVAGGDVAKGTLEVTQKGDAALEIPLRLERVRQLLGMALPAETIVQLLDPLGFRCLARTDAALIFEVPTYRPDVTREVDVIEEVARRYGYGRLPERLPNTESAFHFKPLLPRAQDLARAALLPQGLSEVVNYALSNPQHMAPFVASCGEPVRIRNPLGEELSVLRTTLLPGLLQTLSHQLRHGQRSARLFEVGTVLRTAQGQPVAASEAVDGAQGSQDAISPQAVFAQTPQAPESASVPDASEATAATLRQLDVGLPEEALHVAGLVHGERHTARWYGSGERMALVDAQGALEALLEGFDSAVAITVRPGTAIGLNPFATGTITAEHGDQAVALGYIGRIDPTYAARWSLPDDVFVFEVSLTALQLLPTRNLRARALPKFPSTRRDVAVIAHQDITAEALRLFIAEHAGGAMGPNVVEHVWLFDRYVGKPIAETHVSLAFAMTYRSASGTLTDTDVNEALQNLLVLLPQHFDVTIRQ